MAEINFQYRLDVFFGFSNGLNMDEKAKLFSKNNEYEALINEGNCVGDSEVIIYSCNQLDEEDFRKNLEKKLNSSLKVDILSFSGSSIRFKESLKDLLHKLQIFN